MPVSQQHQDGPDKHSRSAGHDDQGEAQRLKVRCEQQKNYDDGQSQTDGELAEDLLSALT